MFIYPGFTLQTLLTNDSPPTLSKVFNKHYIGSYRTSNSARVLREILLPTIITAMSIKSGSRFGKRDTYSGSAKAKGFLNRAQTMLHAAFRKTRVPLRVEPQNEDTSPGGFPNMVRDVLFEGALTMVDIAQLAQSRSPEQLTRITLSGTLNMRCIIQRRASGTWPSSNPTELSATQPKRHSRQLCEISLSSLAQPSLYFGPTDQLRPRHSGEVLTTGTVVPADSLAEEGASLFTTRPTA